MSKNKTTEVIAAMVTPLVIQAGCELVDVEYIREGASWFLRIYIDKPDGVHIEDCEAVSRPLSELLDKNDPIDQAYILEVSSPGLERPFKTVRDFEKALGVAVIVRFFKPVDGSKQTEGKMIAFDELTITLETDGDAQRTLKRDSIAKIYRKIVF